MSQIAYTMPEPKFRSTKKRVQRPRPAQTHSAGSAGATTATETPKTGPGRAKTAPGPVLVQTRAAQPVAVPAKKAKAAKKESGFALASWWPVAVGLFLTGFSPEWLAMAQQAGIWAVRFAFPLTLIATHKEIGISDQLAPMMPQIALYAQLPLDGLYTKFTLSRGGSLKSAIMQLLFIHGLCTLVLWLITFAAK